jgi:ELWxxDGT repeat protein
MAETRILFTAVGDGFGKELWITDGGSATRITDVNSGAGHSLPSVLGQIGNFVYFSAINGSTTDLYRFDTTSLLVTKVGPTNSRPAFVASVDDKTYISMDDGVNGRELWALTASGASFLGDATPEGSLNPSFGAAIGNTVVFAGSNKDGDVELYATTGGTPTLIKNIRAIGSSEPGDVSGFHEFAGKALFSANDGGGDTLWVTDGSTASELSDVEIPQNFFTYDNGISQRVLFSGQTPGTFDQFLYVYDGSTVTRITDKVEEPSGFTLYKGKVYFTGRTTINGRELWVTDGTAGGTEMVADLTGDGASSSPGSLTVVNGHLMFVDNSQALWTSDGTDEGTTRIRFFQSAYGFVEAGTKAYFTALTSSGGWQIWSTDGTSASVTDLVPSNNGSNINTPLIQGFVTVQGSNKPTNGDDDLVGDDKKNNIDGKKGNDSIDGAGGKDTIKGGAGNDSLKGGAGADKLDGGNGKDTLQGDAGKDTLTGGSGKDTLGGGAGNDKLDGGKDKDIFVFDTAPSSKSNADHIVKFEVGTDKIALDDAVFNVGPSLGKKEFVSLDSGHKATTAKQHIIYDESKGELWYDADGKGGTGPIKFAVLDNEPAKLSVHDFIIV